MGDLGQLLRTTRSDRAMTQVMASDAIGVPQRTYSSWERGQTPGRRNLPAIAEFLGLPKLSS